MAFIVDHGHNLAFTDLHPLFDSEHARIQKVLLEGVQLWQRLFFVLFFCEDPNTAKSGPSSARQRDAILMAFLRQADDGSTLKASLVALWYLGDPDQYC